MYFDFTIPIPQIKGKLYRNKIKETTYICYEFDRTYNKDKKYNTPKRTSIGKVNPSATNMMFPNPKYYEFFPEESFPMPQEAQERSCCLKVGAYLVMERKEYGKNEKNNNSGRKDSKGGRVGRESKEEI